MGLFLFVLAVSCTGARSSADTNAYYIGGRCVNELFGKRSGDSDENFVSRTPGVGPFVREVQSTSREHVHSIVRGCAYTALEGLTTCKQAASSDKPVHILLAINFAGCFSFASQSQNGRSIVNPLMMFFHQLRSINKMYVSVFHGFGTFKFVPWLSNMPNFCFQYLSQHLQGCTWRRWKPEVLQEAFINIVALL